MIQTRSDRHELLVRMTYLIYRRSLLRWHVAQWRSQDLEIGGAGGLGVGSPQWGPRAEPLVGS